MMGISTASFEHYCAWETFEYLIEDLHINQRVRSVLLPELVSLDGLCQFYFVTYLYPGIYIKNYTSGVQYWQIHAFLLSCRYNWFSYQPTSNCQITARSFSLQDSPYAQSRWCLSWQLQVWSMISIVELWTFCFQMHLEGVNIAFIL